MRDSEMLSQLAESNSLSHIIINSLNIFWI